MLEMAQWADGAGWDSVWVGDSIFAKPRLDAIALLGAIAARTKRVRLGPACFASTPLRNPLLLAYQWASLDFLSGGRTVFSACKGQPQPGGGEFDREFTALAIDPRTRVRRMEEAIEILRLTSTREHVDYQGKYTQFRDVTVLPRPVQQPIPIWVTANPSPVTDATAKDFERSYKRVARMGDGWMTTGKTPAQVREGIQMIRNYAQELGRTLEANFEVCVYYNINVNEDRDKAFRESKKFLDDYYTVDYHSDFLELWVAMGSPQQCADSIRGFLDAGATTITLRPTGYDQRHQFKRITEEVFPLLT
jgi:alkanesulfonate monooxygenase SsuD/methylene tetrahydromethanopterin reductase-like flavin-dependent oxidoreductase (luciferase family)